MAKVMGKPAGTKGSDCGAHAAMQKASSPASVKSAATGATKYKHR